MSVLWQCRFPLAVPPPTSLPPTRDYKCLISRWTPQVTGAAGVVQLLISEPQEAALLIIFGRKLATLHGEEPVCHCSVNEGTTGLTTIMRSFSPGSKSTVLLLIITRGRFKIRANVLLKHDRPSSTSTVWIWTWERARHLTRAKQWHPCLKKQKLKILWRFVLMPSIYEHQQKAQIGKNHD